MFEKMEGSPVNTSQLTVSPFPSFSQRSAGIHSSRTELGLFSLSPRGKVHVGGTIGRGGEKRLGEVYRHEVGVWAAAESDEDPVTKSLPSSLPDDTQSRASPCTLKFLLKQQPFRHTRHSAVLWAGAVGERALMLTGSRTAVRTACN